MLSLSFSEQIDWRCDLRDALVQHDTCRMSDSIICVIKIAEEIDNHCWKRHGSLPSRIYERKNLAMRIYTIAR